MNSTGCLIVNSIYANSNPCWQTAVYLPSDPLYISHSCLIYEKIACTKLIAYRQKYTIYYSITLLLHTDWVYNQVNYLLLGTARMAYMAL